MIAALQTPMAGNAVRLIFGPWPSGSSRVVVLRAFADAFTGPNDPTAVVVYSGDPPASVLDVTGLVNGTSYTYRSWSSVDGVTFVTDSTSVCVATPAATYQESGASVQEIVRARFEVGLANEVARGALKPKSGSIPVIDAPFALADGVTFPAVSIHLESDATGDRGLGELLEDDVLGCIGESEGWLANVSLNICGVSLNFDERAALRGSLKRIFAANLGIFADLGLISPTLAISDAEEPGQNNVILYLTRGSFACVMPFAVDADFGQITTVNTQAEAVTP